MLRTFFLFSLLVAKCSNNNCLQTLILPKVPIPVTVVQAATASLSKPAAVTSVRQVTVLQARSFISPQHCSYYCYMRPLCGRVVYKTYQKHIQGRNSVRLNLAGERYGRAAISTMDTNHDNYLMAARNISSILLNSVQSAESTGEVLENAIQEAAQLLHSLKSRAYSFCEMNMIPNDTANISFSENIAFSDEYNSQHITSLNLLSTNAISTVDALCQLVQYVNMSKPKGKKSRQGSKHSSGRAWKALASVVNSSLKFNTNITTRELPITLSVLALGLALSIHSINPAITKMIASAVLPSDEIHRGTDYQKLIESRTDPSRLCIHSMARSAVLGLLRLAVDFSVRSSTNKNGTVDMQIVAKIESGFCVGCYGRSLNSEEDLELLKATADIVNSVLRLGKYSDNGGGDVAAPSNISKDIFAPTLSIIANFRPWGYINVEQLAGIAAEMDLWHSAAILCDAVIDTKVTLADDGEATSSSLISATHHFPAAQRAAQTILNIAFDNRLYRRADLLATKYYSYVGPQRYAEARFLHACDTIEKLIKKRQVQIIERQVESIDEVVATTRRDLASTVHVKVASFQGEDIAIETMSEHIREFSLRRLRASNMHTTATRLALLWGMSYVHDPMQMTQEMEKRKMIYLQWSDDGCPGSNSVNYKAGSFQLPQLISSPTDLIEQFVILQHETGTIGFDCEWHDSINYVALLQLSTTTYSLLLDIPALTKTKEGCDALRFTVGSLFSRSNERQGVIGFSLKDDIKRLRASPCVTPVHWFPQTDRELNVRDLRHMVAEISPRLNDGRGLQNFGLSRLCEAFLGKQLDKAEQCSDWLMRPLSPEQIEYAALDAWACVAIHSKLLQKGNG